MYLIKQSNKTGSKKNSFLRVYLDGNPIFVISLYTNLIPRLVNYECQINFWFCANWHILFQFVSQNASSQLPPGGSTGACTLWEAWSSLPDKNFMEGHVWCCQVITHMKRHAYTDSYSSELKHWACVFGHFSQAISCLLSQTDQMFNWQRGC